MSRFETPTLPTVDPTYCRQFTLPSSLWDVVMGHLDALLNAGAWEQTADGWLVADAIDQIQQMIDNSVDAECPP